MIGDVPKGAPWRCKLGRHKGQENGGTMMFTCPNCGGSYWQRGDYRAVTALADSMIAQGRGDEALSMAQDAVRRGEA